MFANRGTPRRSSLDVRASKEAESQDRIQQLVALGLVDAEPRANVKNKRQNRTTDSNIHVPKKEALDFGTISRRRPSTDRGQNFHKNNDARAMSSLSQLKQRRNSMFASKTRESRRERTFIGSQCAACEEPLEHTLRGERILQLSCGHVSHEACFYEYIKEFEAEECPTCEAPLGLDTSRGGGIDFVNLNKLMKSAQGLDYNDRQRDQLTTPAPWDADTNTDLQSSNDNGVRPPSRTQRDHLLPEQVQPYASQPDRQPPIHDRNRSMDSGRVSTNDHSDLHHTTSRRHDYDVHSMEAAVGNLTSATKNSIPSPKITVRSEFPTLNKSRQQQSLTCLVTVEVVDKQWQPRSKGAPSRPPVPSIPERFQDFSKQSPKPQQAFSPPKPHDNFIEDSSDLEDVKEDLYKRCENWHGLEFQRVGKLMLHDTMRVSKDRQAWQDLECYLFTEMLICVKARKTSPNTPPQTDGSNKQSRSSRVALKGSILIKKHLNQVDVIPGNDILTLSLSVPELPHFYLQFHDPLKLEIWRQRLLNINKVETHEPQVVQTTEPEEDAHESDDGEDTAKSSKAGRQLSSIKSSSFGGARSHTTAPTEYTASRFGEQDLQLRSCNLHVPMDIVVVIPLSSCMQGLKMNVLRDSVRFLVSNLGEGDRMGLVTFGSGSGCAPLVGMTGQSWSGWTQVLDSMRPAGQKNMRADAVDGANVAMDLLMQRKASNPLSSIFLISDSASSDHESIDFVVSRAEAAKVSIHSFGLGLTHKPDTLVELSTKTKANYTYVKDWMMLRESLAGFMGGLQSTSHQNVKLKLRLPEGSPAKFVKISGALQVTKRATGRDAEVSLGDMRFGDKRDILVQLAILPDASTPDSLPADPWDNIISGLEALGGNLDRDETRPVSVEELPLLQADLSWSDLLRNGHLTQLPRPSLLAITMLPVSGKDSAQTPPATPPIPPHPSIVQRRMELLASDMLSRALMLVSRGQAERAHHLLAETRSILKGLNKGSLPPLPPPSTNFSSSLKVGSPMESNTSITEGRRTPSPRTSETPNPFSPNGGIDSATVAALDSELESSAEWISHPAIFLRDSRKAVLQAIGVISSQRAYTFRTPTESLWASRISGIRRLSELSREWRETGNDCLAEE